MKFQRCKEETMKKYYSLIDKIYNKTNISLAIKKVKQGGKGPGIDGITPDQMPSTIGDELHQALKTNSYEAQPVKRVEINQGKKTRKLGLPTVRDKVVQQATKQILEPIFEKDFHPSSYGYRPNKSCEKAIAKAEMFMSQYNLKYVLDMDLSKCFDTLDHEIIIQSFNKKISDGRVLSLLKQFLKSGVVEDNALKPTEIGSPQGGVISPLIANVYLDDFDQHMRKNNIRIVRYADDILVFARTKAQLMKFKQIAQKKLKEMKLRINETKTQTTHLSQGISFLGTYITEHYIAVAKKRIRRIKDKLRQVTRRNRCTPMEQIIKKVNQILRGWINYYKIANCKGLLRKLMSWIRRRLRMIKIAQWKSYKPLHKILRRKGFGEDLPKIAINKWKNSKCYHIHQALPNSYFEALGLFDLTKVKVGILSHYRE